MGYVISAEGIKTQPANVRAMKEYLRPLVLQDLQAFLRVAIYYRKFIKGYSNISRALVDLTKGAKKSSNRRKLLWTPKAVDVSEKL